MTEPNSRLQSETAALVEAVDRFLACHSEQSDRVARGDYAGGKCLHVHWNGGPEDYSCVKRLFDARAALKATA